MGPSLSAVCPCSEEGYLYTELQCKTGACRLREVMCPSSATFGMPLLEHHIWFGNTRPRHWWWTGEKQNPVQLIKGQSETEFHEVLVICCSSTEEHGPLSGGGLKWSHHRSSTNCNIKSHNFACKVVLKAAMHLPGIKQEQKANKKFLL